MEIETKPFGKITVDDRQYINFPLGLFGFEKYTDFVLLDATQRPFYWLQSLSVTSVAFVVINPVLFQNDYMLEIDPHELEDIEITSDNELLLFAIVTIPDDVKAMTANLQGPLVINRKKRLGRQVISINPKWTVKHRLIEEVKVIRQKAC